MAELAKRIRAKDPVGFEGWSDDEIEEAILQEHPNVTAYKQLAGEKSRIAAQNALAERAKAPAGEPKPVDFVDTALHRSGMSGLIESTVAPAARAIAENADTSRSGLGSQVNRALGLEPEEVATESKLPTAEELQQREAAGAAARIAAPTGPGGGAAISGSLMDALTQQEAARRKAERDQVAEENRLQIGRVVEAIKARGLSPEDEAATVEQALIAQQRAIYPPGVAASLAAGRRIAQQTFNQTKDEKSAMQAGQNATVKHLEMLRQREVGAGLTQKASEDSQAYDSFIRSFTDPREFSRMALQTGLPLAIAYGTGAAGAGLLARAFIGMYGTAASTAALQAIYDGKINLEEAASEGVFEGLLSIPEVEALRRIAGARGAAAGGLRGVVSDVAGSAARGLGAAATGGLEEGLQTTGQTIVGEHRLPSGSEVVSSVAQGAMMGPAAGAVVGAVDRALAPTVTPAATSGQASFGFTGEGTQLELPGTEPPLRNLLPPGGLRVDESKPAAAQPAAAAPTDKQNKPKAAQGAVDAAVAQVREHGAKMVGELAGSAVAGVAAKATGISAFPGLGWVARRMGATVGRAGGAAVDRNRAMAREQNKPVAAVGAEDTAATPSIEEALRGLFSQAAEGPTEIPADLAQRAGVTLAQPQQPLTGALSRFIDLSALREEGGTALQGAAPQQLSLDLEGAPAPAPQQLGLFNQPAAPPSVPIEQQYADIRAAETGLPVQIPTGSRVMEEGMAAAQDRSKGRLPIEIPTRKGPEEPPAAGPTAPAPTPPKPPTPPAPAAPTVKATTAEEIPMGIRGAMERALNTDGHTAAVTIGTAMGLSEEVANAYANAIEFAGPNAVPEPTAKTEPQTTVQPKAERPGGRKGATEALNLLDRLEQMKKEAAAEEKRNKSVKPKLTEEMKRQNALAEKARVKQQAREKEEGYEDRKAALKADPLFAETFDKMVKDGFPEKAARAAAYKAVEAKQAAENNKKAGENLASTLKKSTEKKAETPPAAPTKPAETAVQEPKAPEAPKAPAVPEKAPTTIQGFLDAGRTEEAQALARRQATNPDEEVTFGQHAGKKIGDVLPNGSIILGVSNGRIDETSKPPQKGQKPAGKPTGKELSVKENQIVPNESFKGSMTDEQRDQALARIGKAVEAENLPDGMHEIDSPSPEGMPGSHRVAIKDGKVVAAITLRQIPGEDLPNPHVVREHGKDAKQAMDDLWLKLKMDERRAGRQLFQYQKRTLSHSVTREAIKAWEKRAAVSPEAREYEIAHLHPEDRKRLAGQATPKVEYSAKEATSGQAAGAVREGRTGSPQEVDRGAEHSIPEADRGSDLEGLPAVVQVEGKQVRFGGFRPAQESARDYVESTGRTYTPNKKYAKVNPQFAKRVASAFDAMKHDPNDPIVKAAYKAMIEETIAQYEKMLESGLQVEFINGPDPYANPRQMIMDVVQNNHLWVFKTDDGFGSSGFEASGNPLLAPTRFKISGQVALANDIFRAVHDYYGHVKDGVGFRADGEENAWRSHAAMYSPLARRAMTTETRGQNSWVNYGPHGETNRTAKSGETVYADQKTGLLPEWASRLPGDTPTLAEVRAALPQYYADRTYKEGDTFVIDTPGIKMKLLPTGEIEVDLEALEEGRPGAAEKYKAGLIRIVGEKAYIDGEAIIQFVENGAINHEVRHVAWDLLTGREQAAVTKALAAEAKRRNVAVTEVFADGVGKFMKAPSAEPTTTLGKLYKKIADFFNGIYTAIRPSLESVEGLVESGKVFERTKKSTGRAEYAQKERKVSWVTPEDQAKNLREERSALTGESYETEKGRGKKIPPRAPTNETKVVNGVTYGPVTTDEWISRLEGQIRPGSTEWKNARHWYSIMRKLLKDQFPKLSDNDIGVLAFGITQKGTSPTGGILALLRGIDIGAGFKAIKNPGTVVTSKQIADLLSEMIEVDISFGTGQKLSDLLDPLTGNEDFRSWTGPEGMFKPAAIDRHALTDVGYISDAVNNRLGGVFDVDVYKDTPSDAQYLYALKFYNELADELNSRGYDGGGWTPSQVQAIGWTAIRKAQGLETEDAYTAIENNTKRIMAEVTGFAGDSPLGKRVSEILKGVDIPIDTSEEITRTVGPELIKRAAKIANVQVLDAEPGFGGWIGGINANLTSRILGSTEAISRMMNILGKVANQTEVLAVRQNPRGDEPGLVFKTTADLGKHQKVSDVWKRAIEIEKEGLPKDMFGEPEGKTFMDSAGYTRIMNPDGSSSLLILRGYISPKQWTKAKQVIADSIAKAIQEADSKASLDIIDGNFDKLSANNPWDQNSNGEVFRQGYEGHRAGIETEVDALSKWFDGEVIRILEGKKSADKKEYSVKPKLSLGKAFAPPPVQASLGKALSAIENVKHRRRGVKGVLEKFVNLTPRLAPKKSKEYSIAEDFAAMKEKPEYRVPVPSGGSPFRANQSEKLLARLRGDAAPVTSGWLAAMIQQRNK